MDVPEKDRAHVISAFRVQSLQSSKMEVSSVPTAVCNLRWNSLLMAFVATSAGMGDEYQLKSVMMEISTRAMDVTGIVRLSQAMTVREAL